MMILASSRQFLKRGSLEGEYLNYYFSLFFAISCGALAGEFVIWRSFFFSFFFIFILLY